MDYTQYLPDIDAANGLARVMNNTKLYLRLVGKFDSAKMAAAIAAAIEQGDAPTVAQAAHAMRGTAANLAFPVVLGIVSKIEETAKAGGDASEHIGELKTAVESLAAAVGRLLTDCVD